MSQDHSQIPRSAASRRDFLRTPTGGLLISVDRSLERRLLDDEVDLAVQNMQQSHQLVDRFLVIRLVQQAIELGR